MGNCPHKSSSSSLSSESDWLAAADWPNRTGSNNGFTWTILRNHQNDSTIPTKALGVGDWALESGQKEASCCARTVVVVGRCVLAVAVGFSIVDACHLTHRHPEIFFSKTNRVWLKLAATPHTADTQSRTRGTDTRRGTR